MDIDNLTEKDLKGLRDYINREGCYMVLSNPDLVGKSIYYVIEKLIDSQREDANRSGIAKAQHDIQKALGLK